jgi:hypothetical protein
MPGMFPGGRIVFQSYGVTAEVVVEDPSLVAEVSALLPPGWEPADGAQASATFTLTAGGDVIADGETIAAGAGRAAALDVLESVVRARVAAHARDHIFVHAGVVARGARAIVIPGSAFSGKTTLVAALVRAGADYYSDEFAVLDKEGCVHPYARPLSMRLDASLTQTDVAVGALGGVAGDGAAEVAVIAATGYVAGHEWDPSRGSTAEGALALLSHAIPVRERPAQALAAARRAAEGATVLEGIRGEAEPAAEALLATLDEIDVPR